jgi:hypothetical protein
VTTSDRLSEMEGNTIDQTRRGYVQEMGDEVVVLCKGSRNQEK